MSAWSEEVDEALLAFVAVAELAGDPVARDEIETEFLAAPHRPPAFLPAGKMAVYGFCWDGSWLKIGKAGPNSNARFCSQHYSLNAAQSTLAKSLANDSHMRAVAGFDPQNPGMWMKASTCRVNVLIPANRRKELLSLMEAFLHLRLGPRYEG